MKIMIRKITAAALIVLIAFMPVTPQLVLAQEVTEGTETQTQTQVTQTENPAPTESPASESIAVTDNTGNTEVSPTPSVDPTPSAAPVAPTAPTPPTAPVAPTAPTPPSAPTPPTAPSSTALTVPSAPSGPVAANTTPSSGPTVQGEGQVSGIVVSDGAGTAANGNVGNTGIVTGNADSSAKILSSGNSNSVVAENPVSGTGSVSVANSGNGENSINSGSVSQGSGNTTDQTNNASVNNNLLQKSQTGGSSTSFNSGNSSIDTGNANTTGTIITSVNTNVDGISLAEFSVADDHVGDIILDFGAGCISGCGSPSTSLINQGNAANSVNGAVLNGDTANTANQTNIAGVANNLNLSADSGDNAASFNTGGDSSITTGDANVAANVLTFANNNIAGNVIYSVVNIFGNLTGDIILTEAAMNAFCGNCLNNETAAANTGNGTGSVNTGTVDQNTTNSTYQFNLADINNNLILNANTGDNDASFNTGGNSTIQTGTASVDASVLNIANTNLAGGNLWLVIVNEAGKWIGRILGAPTGSAMAASDGIEFVVDDNGEVVATNNANGAGSVNNAEIDQNSTNTTNQTNNAEITNNLNLSANTGKNNTNYNTGGDSNITTGDANIVANIVNFVNNNIAGTGKLFVTVVNVFGSWIGDFVSPGQDKEEKTQVLADSDENHALGGTSDNSGKSTSGNNNQGNNSPDSGGTSIRQTQQLITKAAGNVRTLIAGSRINATKSVEDEGSELGMTNNELISNEVSGNKIHINLAWLLILSPFIAGVFLVRKKRLHLKTVSAGYNKA